MTFPVLSANGPSGYKLTRSLRFRSSASAYLNRTPASATNRSTWTWSGWVKRGVLTDNSSLFSVNGVTDTTYFLIRFDSSVGALYVGNYSTSFVITSQVFRDPSSWYHIVVVLDTTQATANNRLKIYVNGLQVTAFSSNNIAAQIAQNSSQGINQAAAHNIGREPSGYYYLDGYLAEVNFIDGQALTPSSFGSTNAITGVWQPAKYGGTYGTNGFYLPFTDTTSTTTLGYDSSGNGNNWTTNNISLTAGATYDSMTDVPTLTSATAANFCVGSPLNYRTTTPTPTITDGNLKWIGPSASLSSIGCATFGVASGKFYWEATRVGTSTGFIGVVNGQFNATTSNTFDLGYNSNEYAYISSGNKVNNNSNVAYGASYTSGDVIGFALDLNAGTLTFYKNNTSQGVAYSGLSLGNYWLPALDSYNSAGFTLNFGQQGFTYTPPSGFVALNTYNLPASTVLNGASYMAATLYTGTGASLTVANTVGSASFQPDFVWAKGRSGATDYALYDSVRGVQKQIESNNTDAETTETTGLTAFGSTGFTVGALAQMNTSSATYVAWSWKAGGTAVSNTNGSITSSVSANTTSGFSVVTYTGTGVAGTIGHGLGVAPSMIIVKSRSAVGAWPVYHSTLGNGSNVFLNTTAASTASATIWNATSPTSSVFSVGINTDSNTVTATYVAYCFAAIKGFSAFGGYTGNGSTDGPFIYTGFRPRYILIKRTDTSTGADWFTYDTSRNPYNTANLILFPNLSDAEAASGGASYLDILSNGFKARGNSNGINVSAATYIYMAFAESPFQNSLAR